VFHPDDVTDDHTDAGIGHDHQADSHADPGLSVPARL
jgi:hypothetical protein